MAIPVPALVVDVDALDHNIRTIGETLPGPAPATARQGFQVDCAGTAPG